MKASVIIPTYNRKNTLVKILSCYIEQSQPEEDYELVVIDDGSIDATSEIFQGLSDLKLNLQSKVVDKHIDKIKIFKMGKLEIRTTIPGIKRINVKYIKISRSGRSIARNIGIAFSSYPLIIFADDDIFVEHDFIKKHIKEHNINDKLVVMGKVIHTKDINNPFSARWKLKDINTAFLSTGNASVLKRHLIKADLFDEGYSVYGWEDFDLGVHLKELGLKSVKKRIYGYHYSPILKELDPKKVYGKEKERGFTAVYFYKNHTLRWVKHFTLINNGFLKFVFNFLGKNNWFLSYKKGLFLKGIVLLIIRYKGYFNGIDEGKKLYDKIEKRKDLIIFTNGPGEVSTWVIPVVEWIKSRENLRNAYRVILVIHPCQFASGTEHIVAKSLYGIELVINPGDYLKIILTGYKRKRYFFSKEGIIFSLGGDLMHPVLFKKRLKGRHKLYAYTNNCGWERHYEKIFVRNDYIRNKFLDRGVSQDKIKIVGDLVYSSLKFENNREEVRSRLNISDDEKSLVFMPGSRDFEVNNMLPVFLKVIDELTDKIKNVKVFILKSPYVSYELLEKALLNGGNIKEAETISGKLKTSDIDNHHFIEFSRNKSIVILEGGLDYWGMGIDFAVTLPGTNTIQLAYRKIPALVISPLNKPEVIPIEGISGILKWIPLIGQVMLKVAVKKYVKKFPFASLPNIYEDEEVFPELFGVIKTNDITKRLIEIFEEKEYENIKKKLSRFVFKENPVDLIGKEVWGNL